MNTENLLGTKHTNWPSCKLSTASLQCRHGTGRTGVGWPHTPHFCPHNCHHIVGWSTFDFLADGADPIINSVDFDPIKCPRCSVLAANYSIVAAHAMHGDDGDGNYGLSASMASLVQNEHFILRLGWIQERSAVFSCSAQHGRFRSVLRLSFSNLELSV